MASHDDLEKNKNTSIYIINYSNEYNISRADIVLQYAELVGPFTLNVCHTDIQEERQTRGVKG